MLAGSADIDNHKPIFIKKRSPKIDKDIRSEASEPNLITTTRNFEIRVFVKKPNNQLKSIGIKSSPKFEDLAPQAAQRQQQHVKRSKRTHTFDFQWKKLQRRQ